MKSKTNSTATKNPYAYEGVTLSKSTFLAKMIAYTYSYGRLVKSQKTTINRV